jgi:hypothetical protein
MMAACWIFVAVIIFVISVWTFLFFDMKMNGLTHGQVTGKSFQAAHEEQRSNTIMVGKTPITTYYTVHIDDRWFIQLKGDNGRVEDWVTYNPNAADAAKDGVDVTKDDNWSWNNTEKRHGDKSDKQTW